MNVKKEEKPTCIWTVGKFPRNIPKHIFGDHSWTEKYKISKKI